MVGPRCFSWAEPRAILLILLVVVVLCLPDCEAARKKKPCKYNRKKYKPGEVIASVEDNCAEIRCSEKGKKIVLQPMKNCVCDKEGKQEEITNTTMDFMYNANINLNEKAAKKKKPCKYNRKNYMPGKVIEALEDNCVELKCSRKGKKTVLELIKNCVCGKEVPTGDGSVSKILDSSGTPYGPPDRVIDGDIRSHWNPFDLPRYHNNWYIVFELMERSAVDSMGLRNYGDTTHDVTSFTLEGSDDKVNWYNGGAANNVQTGTSEWQSFENLNATGKYVKFTITQTYEGWQPWLCEISFTECTPMCQNGGTCSAASVCKCPQGWLGDACEKKVTNIDVRINHIIDSSGTPSGPPGRVIDGDIKTHWNPFDLPRYHNNWYIVFELAKIQSVERVTLINYGDNTHDITSFMIEVSNDNVNWYNGGSVDKVQTGTREHQSFDNFKATGKYLKFMVTQTYEGWQPWLCEISFTGYYATVAGPYKKIWGDDECSNIGGRSGNTLSECKELCHLEDNCTALNYREDPPNCILRACGMPVPPPQWNYPIYQGYAIDTDIITVDEYLTKFKKTYENEDELKKRIEVYHENVQIMNEHNELYKASLSSFKMGVNKYTDMTYNEVVAKLTGALEPNLTQRYGSYEYYEPKIDLGEEPSYLDYRDKGVVNPIRDQGFGGTCGCCYAFATVASIESKLALLGSGTIELSEQDLVDCSRAYGNHGCKGGDALSSISYAMQTGIPSMIEYPYIAAEGQCLIINSRFRNVIGHKRVIEGREDHLLNALVNTGPLYIAMYVSRKFMSHKSGVLYDKECSIFDGFLPLNHAMTLVGYGTEYGQDYWLIRNSWGPDWGENGYVKLARNFNNLCGIASSADIPIVRGPNGVM